MGFGEAVGERWRQKIFHLNYREIVPKDLTLGKATPLSWLARKITPRARREIIHLPPACRVRVPGMEWDTQLVLSLHLDWQRKKQFPDG